MKWIIFYAFKKSYYFLLYEFMKMHGCNNIDEEENKKWLRIEQENPRTNEKSHLVTIFRMTEIRQVPALYTVIFITKIVIWYCRKTFLEHSSLWSFDHLCPQILRSDHSFRYLYFWQVSLIYFKLNWKFPIFQIQNFTANKCDDVMLHDSFDTVSRIVLIELFRTVTRYRTREFVWA